MLTGVTVSQPKSYDPTQPTAKFVLSALRKRIVTGELTPGSRIVERRLCEDLNVSRTPLREALKLLEIDGLVELSQHRGATVRPLLAEEAGELFDVLAILEGHAARRTAERLTPDDLSELAAIHARMHTHYDAGERDPYFHLNTSVHQRIVALSANAVLMETHTQLALRAERWRYHAIADANRWRAALGEHGALMDALSRGDAAAAGRIWQDHTIKTGAALMASHASAHLKDA